MSDKYRRDAAKDFSFVLPIGSENSAAGSPSASPTGVELARSHPSATPASAHPLSECIGTGCVVPSPTVISAVYSVVATPDPRSIHRPSETSGCMAIEPGDIPALDAPVGFRPGFVRYAE